MSTITKIELINKINHDIGLSKTESKELVDLFFETICGSLEKGSQVRLSGFGNFVLRDKASRPGRNPKTGESIDITPRRVVTFKSSTKLKKSVEKYIGEEIKNEHCK